MYRSILGVMDSLEDTPDRLAIRIEVRGLLLRDASGPGLDSISAYLPRFPSYEDIVAEEYAAKKRSASSPAGGSCGGAARTGSVAEIVGQYRLDQEIGRGGQGTVYRATDLRIGRTVALKVLRGFGADARELLLRFKREAQAASRADHPGICPVFDAGVVAGVPFIAMRHIDGVTLTEVIVAARDESSRAVGKRSDVMARARLVEKVARALHAIHEAGVVHRDVKPGNVMVTPEDEAIVMDFGLARDDAGDVDTLTRTGDLFGTPAYMSPEQISLQARIDERSDVWSAGIVLYECLTLTRPFEAPSRERLYRSILGSDPVSPRRLNPAVPKDLATVALTALQKNRDRRYSSARELADDIRRALSYEPIVARPPTWHVRTARWVQRRPAAAAAIAILVAGVVVSTWFAVDASTNLAAWERLADGRRVEDLLRSANGPLWPAVPQKIGRISRWLRDARELVGKLPDHGRALEHLRSRGRYDAAGDRKRWAKELARIEEIEFRLGRADQELAILRRKCTDLRSQLAAYEAKEELSSREKRRAAWVKRRLARDEEALAAAPKEHDDLRAERRELERIVGGRASWRFSDEGDQLRHDKLRDLLTHLRALGKQPSPREVTIAGVARRLAFARELQRRLENEDATAWARCLADVARPTSPYSALSVRPVAGLVPLGTDEDSGLWEFWHVASGDQPTWRGEPLGPGRVLLDPESGAEGIVLVLVPSDSFSMGAWRPGPSHPKGAPNVDVMAQAPEAPVHRVTLSAYWLSKYEVTQGQWHRLWAERPSALQAGSSTKTGVRITPRHPLTNIDWNAAKQACHRWGLELPTEAQWEHACRAGTSTTFASGNTLSALGRHANIGDATRSKYVLSKCSMEVEDGFIETAPVGSLRANALGLHDMHGNVFEWCLDGYYEYGDRRPRTGDGLRGPLVGARHRVLRGGCFFTPAHFARSAFRSMYDPGFLDHCVGFRAALSVSAGVASR